MKSIKSSILVLFMLLFSFSCDEALDINTDPLSASSADPNAVLPYTIVQYSNRKVTELGTRISDVSQYISANFNSPRNGTTSIFLTGNTWGMMYNLVLGNLSLVEADALAAGESSNNVAAIAKIFSSLIFYELTSIWEEVPYTQALDGQQFPQPDFDDQETVLTGVVNQLDSAMTLIDNIPASGSFNVSVGDMIYEGNMTQWRKYANSLKLRVLMMLRNGGANVDSQIQTALNNPLIEDGADAAYLSYAGGPGAENAWNTIVTAFFGGTNESSDVHGPGDPLYNLLDGTGDPRFDLWIARNDLDPPGNAVFPDPTTSVISNNVIRSTLPDMWMLPDEIWFYRAELQLAGGFTDAVTATEAYQNGVRESLEWWGQEIPGAVSTITTAEITAYVSSLGTPTLNDVYNQEYLAAFLMPVLAWNHVRRNDVPALTPPPATVISSILKRFNYPPDEVAANSNTPANPATDEPMWFEN